jgi:hypothetical protein
MPVRRNLFNLFIFSFIALFFSEIVTAQSGSVTVNQDEKIPELLELKKKLEKENKLSDGFTIQLYYGNLNRANSIIKDYRNKYGSWPASIEYETPNYKVWVGDFTTRIEADRALLDVHRNFPSAFVLKPNK